MRTTSAVQPLSCDEAYLDVTGLGDPEEIARRLRSQIAEATGCPASAGIGPNPLVARLVRRRRRRVGFGRLSGSQGVHRGRAPAPCRVRFDGVGCLAASRQPPGALAALSARCAVATRIREHSANRPGRAKDLNSQSPPPGRPARPQATKRAKPNGQFRVTAAQALDFMADMAADQLPGGGIERGTLPRFRVRILLWGQVSRSVSEARPFEDPRRAPPKRQQAALP